MSHLVCIKSALQCQRSHLGNPGGIGWLAEACARCTRSTDAFARHHNWPHARQSAARISKKMEPPQQQQKSARATQKSRRVYAFSEWRICEHRDEAQTLRTCVSAQLEQRNWSFDLSMPPEVSRTFSLLKKRVMCIVFTLGDTVCTVHITVTQD